MNRNIKNSGVSISGYLYGVNQNFSLTKNAFVFLKIEGTSLEHKKKIIVRFYENLR